MRRAGVVALGVLIVVGLGAGAALTMDLVDSADEQSASGDPTADAGSTPTVTATDSPTATDSTTAPSHTSSPNHWAKNSGTKTTSSRTRMADS